MIKFLRKHDFTFQQISIRREVVNYLDRWERHHADNEWFTRSAENMPTLFTLIPGRVMMILIMALPMDMNGIPLGGRQDFVTRELQGRELTIELDDDYITPVNELHDLWSLTAVLSWIS